MSIFKIYLVHSISMSGEFLDMRVMMRVSGEFQVKGQMGRDGFGWGR